MIDPNKTLLEIATTLNTISDVLCNMNDMLLEILEGQRLKARGSFRKAAVDLATSEQLQEIEEEIEERQNNV